MNRALVRLPTSPDIELLESTRVVPQDSATALESITRDRVPCALHTPASDELLLNSECSGREQYIAAAGELARRSRLRDVGTAFLENGDLDQRLASELILEGETGLTSVWVRGALDRTALFSDSVGPPDGTFLTNRSLVSWIAEGFFSDALVNTLYEELSFATFYSEQDRRSTEWLAYGSRIPLPRPVSLPPVVSELPGLTDVRRVGEYRLGPLLASPYFLNSRESTLGIYEYSTGERVTLIHGWFAPPQLRGLGNGDLLGEASELLSSSNSRVFGNECFVTVVTTPENLDLAPWDAVIASLDRRCE
ncbi:MAG: hypothetical protein AAF658_06920 [Myxococcota bacterium]